MHKAIAFVLSALVAVGAIAAPASQDQVEELLALTRVEAMMDQMHGTLENMMRQGMQQTVQGKALDAEQRQVLDKVPANFVAVIKEEFTWSKLKPLYIQLYTETFDQSEIDGLIAFYKTTVGQAFVAKMPVLMQKSMVMMQAQMQSYLPKMKAAMDEAFTAAKVTK